MKISVLGCGRWGSCIAWYLDKTGHDVTVWGMDTDPYVTNFFATRKNNYVEFPNSINLTCDLNEALASTDTAIISIPAQNVRSFMENLIKIEGYNKKNYVLCMKGIEEKTGKRLSEVLMEFGIDKNNIAVWVGPGHIQDFVRGIPGVMVIDSYNQDLARNLIKNFKSSQIKYYLANDMIGTEIGAAAKNVIGIAAGMLDGIGYSSLKGGLMARGAYEVSKLIAACGGNKMSAFGLCHLGDYEATLFSQNSHNRKFGELFVKHEYFDKLAEGVKTSGALLKLAKKYNVSMPITQTVYNIVMLGKDYKEELKGLFERESSSEFSY